MVCTLKSLGLFGMNAFVVTVESDLSIGLPAFDIVGLPDISVKESRNRVRAALKNSGFEFPVGRITVNLAPANVRKEGSIYDLPILISLLQISGQIEVSLKDSAFVGELSLSGSVKPVCGVLPMVIEAKKSGFKSIYVPYENVLEGAIVEGIDVYPVKNVEELLRHLNGKVTIAAKKFDPQRRQQSQPYLNFAQVKGQYQAKRALEIAASGGHNVLLIGPPGSGKSMLAKRLPSILPDLTFEEAIESTVIHSVAGLLSKGSSLLYERPFRSPHHTISSAGLVGGGVIPKPGEISLANHGVLFLDELPEFSRSSLEVLRQPIEDAFVTISRAQGTVSYPCSVILVAAMNPCPCGYFGHPTKACICSPSSVSRYLSKVSGPLLDRMDLHIEVPAIEFKDISSDQLSSESSASIKERVNRAREIQNERYKQKRISCNARLNSEMLHAVCVLSDSAKSLLKRAFETLGLSARAYDKLLKIARTIADLDGKENIEEKHLAEAIGYRSLDRKYRKEA